MTNNQIDDSNNNQRQETTEQPRRIYKSNPFIFMMLFIIGSVILVMAVLFTVLAQGTLGFICVMFIVLIIIGMVGMSSERVLIFSDYTEVKASNLQPGFCIQHCEVVAVETEYYKNILVHTKNQGEENTYEISLSNMYPEDRENIFKHFQGIVANNCLDKT